MKLYAFCSVLLATTFSALSVAKVLLEPLPLTIHAGDIHEISWSTDQSYALELVLVRKGDAPPVAWTTVETIFEERIEAPGSGSYNWSVPNVALNGSYGLWLSGEGHPYDGTGYANLTRWFEIEGTGSGRGCTLSPSGQVGAAAMACLAIAAIFMVVRAFWKSPRMQLDEGHERGYYNLVEDEKTEAKLTVQEVNP